MLWFAGPLFLVQFAGHSQLSCPVFARLAMKIFKKDKSARNQRELTDEEIEQILEVAGPTLERLGYL